MGRVFCIILEDPIGFTHRHTRNKNAAEEAGGGAFMWQVRGKLWQFLHLAYSQLTLEAAEINTSKSSGTQADYRTPPQKQSKWLKKESARCANNMVIMWANWEIKMTWCRAMVKVEGKLPL